MPNKSLMYQQHTLKRNVIDISIGSPPPSLPSYSNIYLSFRSDNNSVVGDLSAAPWNDFLGWDEQAVTLFPWLGKAAMKAGEAVGKCSRLPWSHEIQLRAARQRLACSRQPLQLSVGIVCYRMLPLSAKIADICYWIT